MLILALDTTSAAGSAALLRDGAVLVERSGDPARTHGERLPRELMELLDAAGAALNEIDLFAVAVGPGSFTGLRVGIASIQGLALAQSKRVVPVSSLDALAWTARGGAARIATWIDAHRGEVYAALYEPDGSTAVEAPAVRPPDTALDALASMAFRDNSTLRFAGDGAARYRDRIIERLGSGAAVDVEAPALAAAVAEIAFANPPRAVRPHAVVPLYVRRPDAEIARDRARNG